MNAIANAVNRIRVGEPETEIESDVADDSDSKHREPVKMRRATVEAAARANETISLCVGGDSYRIKTAISNTKELLEKVADEILNDTGEGDFSNRKSAAASWSAAAVLYEKCLTAMEDAEAARETAANTLRKLIQEENTARAYAAHDAVGHTDGLADEDLNLIINRAAERGHLFDTDNEWMAINKLRGVGRQNFLDSIKRNKIAPSAAGIAPHELSKVLLTNPVIRT